MKEAPAVGVHSVYESDIRSGIRAVARAGFQYVQFDLNVPTFFLDKLSRRDLREIRALADDSGVRLSFHAPGESVGMYTDFPLLRRGLLDQMKLILDRAGQLNAHHVVFHLLRPPAFLRADTRLDEIQTRFRDHYKAVLKENLTELANSGGTVIVTVENCHLESIAIESLDEMFQQGTDLFLSLDWAKLHRADGSRDDDQYRFFQRHSPRIREIHLHDMDMAGTQHLAVGEGRLDFGLLFSQFYDGSQWLTLEVRPLEEAARSKAALMTLLEH